MKHLLKDTFPLQGKAVFLLARKSKETVSASRECFSFTCFKETALLFNVHLSFVDFILCTTDKYMFKVNNKKVRLLTVKELD